MIECTAGHMRRRTPQGEAFVVSPDHWLRASSESIVPWKFLADGWFQHGQNCHEYLELNFGLAPYRRKSEPMFVVRPYAERAAQLGGGAGQHFTPTKTSGHTA